MTSGSPPLDNPPGRGSNFAALDGMRGLAALLVLTRHTPGLWGAWDTKANHTYLAVDLFFILSGFVISHAYAARLREGRMSSLEFVRVRWVRLFPLLAVGALLGVAIGAQAFLEQAGPQAWPMLFGALALSLLFLPFRIEGDVRLFPFNSPLWSLFFEMVVNVVFGLFHRLISVRRLAWIVGTCGVLLAALGIYNGTVELGFNWGARSLAGGFLRSALGILGGVLLHMLFVRQRRHHRVPGGAWPPVLISAAVLVIPIAGRFDWAVDILAIAVVFPTCIWAGASAGVGSRSTRVFMLLGVLSYPVYVLHVPLFEWLGEPLLANKDLGALSGVAFALVVAAVALTFDRFYDRPMRRWLGKLLLRDAPARGTRPAPVAPTNRH